MTNPGVFVFRRHDTVGSADAEQDEWLSSCFVDTGDLAVLRDSRDPRRLVMGRTGSGKTALLRRLSEVESRVLSVRAESLALSHVSNSTVLKFLLELGVKLDVFFKLLWRHVFTVEVLKAHFKLRNESHKSGMWDWVKNLVRDKSHEQALKYLEDWGTSFWQETDYRVKEVTTKLETDVKAAIGAPGIAGLTLGADANKKMSEEVRHEVVQRAQNVVNRCQIRELSAVIDLLDEVLEDPQKRYYIVIDRLDENWVEDKVRYLLIRALVESVPDFLKVQNLKIVVALRYDLLDRVFRATRDPGFQEEKYESLYLSLGWSREQLTDLLDRRIDHLVKPRYTNSGVTHATLLPAAFGRDQAIDYLIDRTMMRPRDVILFFNACISRAHDRPLITRDMMLEAEGEYSRLRLRSLADEWYSDYPSLPQFVQILKNRPPSFDPSAIPLSDYEELCLNVMSDQSGPIRTSHDELETAAARVVDGLMQAAEFRRELFRIFYRVGIAELKLERYESTSWSMTGQRSISSAEIQENIRVSVHPCFWRTLGIAPPC